MADDSAASRFLLDAASSRLAVLRRNLDEYLRKCNYQYHDEPKTAAELASWRGTVAFLAGERSA
jgi:predicted solute-binding protein